MERKLDLTITITNKTKKEIAKDLMEYACEYDRWIAVRKYILWFVAGASLIAAMDFGDVWLCVGECGSMPRISVGGEG